MTVVKSFYLVEMRLLNIVLCFRQLKKQNRIDRQGAEGS